MKATTCAMVLYRTFVQIPMWLVLMGGTLKSVDAPHWLWCLFIAYCITTPVYSICHAILITNEERNK